MFAGGTGVGGAGVFVAVGSGVGVLVGGLGVFVAVGTGVGVSVGGMGVFVAVGSGVFVAVGSGVGVSVGATGVFVAGTLVGVGVQSLGFFDVPAPAGPPALEGRLTHEALFAPWSA